MPENEFMNWRAGDKYRDLADTLKTKLGLSSRADVMRRALDCLAELEGVTA